MRIVHRVIATLCLGMSVVGIAPAPAPAQLIQPAAVSRPSRAGLPDPRLTFADTARRPSVWWYVGGGAVVGAGVAAIGFALDDSGKDAILYEVVVAVVVPASALLGAGLGWLIHRVQY